MNVINEDLTTIRHSMHKFYIESNKNVIITFDQIMFQLSVPVDDVDFAMNINRILQIISLHISLLVMNHLTQLLRRVLF